MRIIRYFLIVLILLAGIGFASLNAEMINIDLYVNVYHLPLSLCLVLVLGLGIFLGSLVFGWKFLTLRSENRQLKNRLTLTEKEVSGLRMIPLKHD